MVVETNFTLIPIYVACDLKPIPLSAYYGTTVCVQVKRIGCADSPSQRRKRPQQQQSGAPAKPEGRDGEQQAEEDPVKRQLHTYIKRVAELETRVEELIIRAEVGIETF